MSQETIQDNDQARLRKLDKIEELAAGLQARWRRVGRLSALEEEVKELLAEIRRSPERIKRQKAGRQS